MSLCKCKEMDRQLSGRAFLSGKAKAEGGFEETDAGELPTVLYITGQQ